ncbi:uncharacterized protein with beta-barrel porin domain [Hoeflea marina]|uniref:Uncharacterized protein with beta-barrel porin domain n=1 Tax=Hoeflea marina TaxID=274592 RepID=A0A317PSZ8_9HYPH|nr:G8 domain-containing protein [Hoeflea marina]PWW04583.1 uncharacterized protein with beta-barrel porin domain [Hoeflea marina]
MAPTLSVRVALLRHGATSSCRNAGVERHRSLMRLGVAGAALLAGAGAAAADDVSWINSSTVEMRWEDGGNWSGGTVPAQGDTVTIATGNSGLYTDVTVETVNIESGTLWINRNAELNADTVEVTGGRLALSQGNPAAPNNSGPQGIANISTLLTISGGTVERFGLIELGDAGTVIQSGGEVLNPVQIHTPSYVQTGGAMVGLVTASTYAISGAEGVAATHMAGTVTLGTEFTMADGALVSGTVAGDGNATMLQTGGTMDGSASGLTSYAQTGGTIQGQIGYTETFDLSGDGTVVWGAQLVGDSGAVFEQSGGTMGGTVQFEDGAGISKYVQTGGEMTGTVTTGTYEASGGTIVVHSNVGFSELFALSGDASLGDIYLIGDGDAAMTQSGGTMGAWVSGIETYTMTGGTILQATEVVTDAFVQSGGTINDITEENDWRATVRFATEYELSGDATIGLANLIGGADATMTQSGGTMGGHVYSETESETIAKYTQTGGDMTGQVTTETYEASGGTVSGSVVFSDLFAMSGDAVVGEGYSLIGDGDALMTQSGGTMAGGVSGIATYTMSGGTITGTVDFTDHFELSDGRIEYVDIVGDIDATMTQSGGSMGGAVWSLDTDDYTIAKYTQTGGTMNAEVYARTYDVSGGSVDGMVRFSELFALSGDATVGDHYIWGYGAAVATQSGGTMGGVVSDITGYTQSGGAMTNYVATEDYALSGGSISGTGHVDFTDLFTLSGSGEVLAEGTLSGDTTAQMAQSGGTMSGHVNGITGYTQSDGTMDGKVDAADYTQSGGTMGGEATAQTYALAGGTLSGTANFGTSATLSGTGSVTSTGKLIGDGSATVAQTGGAMDGTVTGVTGYTQSGGTMGGETTAQTYALSGGTLSGTANFGTSAALSGTGSVTSTGQLIGDGSATVAQSGGAMDGTVSGVTGYTQSGGTMGGKVTTGSYELLGGVLSGDVTFSTLFALSGDSVVTSSTQLTQTGGSMDSTLSGIASYTQSGGAMGGDVTATTYTLSGGTLTGKVAGFSSFELSGDPSDVIVTGTLIGASGSTVTQTGGKMNGNVSGIATYVQQERVGSAAVISFSELYDMVDGQVDTGAKIIGGAGSVMTQSGPGKMGGSVTGVASYTQTAGTMNGSVSTGDYTLSAGTVSKTVNFSGAFTLGSIDANSAGQVNGSAVLTGGAGSTMTQSAGSMKGTVSGVSSYTQTDGTMGGAQDGKPNVIVGKVGTGTYDLSGGTVGGQVNFSTLFALSGTGDVASTATLTGGSGSTMTQSAGTMGGTVTGAATYAQSGGTMSGTVSTGSYELLGGVLSGDVTFSTLFALSGDGVMTSSTRLTQTGGSMDSTLSGIASYTQTGGTMSGATTAASYTLSAGTLSGDANFSTLFALSGSGDVTAAAELTGNGEAVMTQSGGTMAGTVTGVTSYTQSGGTMSGATTAASYTLSAGTLSGDANFSTLFALSGSADVTAAAELTGNGEAVMTQSGGTMAGTVTGIASYAQSGGTMSGATTAASYTLSAGILSGDATFSTLLALSGTGGVTSTSQLTGGSGSTMTQSGGTMAGTVTGIASYAQSGGTMSGATTAASYTLSAGTLSGDANFSTLLALSGTGGVTSTAQLTGGSGSTITQSAGTMAGTVTGIASYTQSGGTMTGATTAASYTLSAGTLSGDADFSTLFSLSGTGEISSAAELTGSGDAAMTQSAGTMNGSVAGAKTYTQSGGTMSGDVAAASFALSGGTLSGDVDFSTLFSLSDTGSIASTALLAGGAGATMTQSGGTMDGTITGIDSYTQSGGTMTGDVTTLAYNHVGGSASGTIDVATYSLSGASASWSGTITASSAFNLGFDGGTATIGAKLSGAGDLVKSGTSTVVLANSANDFSGSVAINGGVLEVRDAALPGEATVTVADSATLRFNTAAGVSVVFDGIMTGDGGILDKTGLGTLTLGGDIELGALLVNGGVLNIGNGEPEEASFQSAYIGVGATVYVASGATLRIRIPQNIANFGTLVNDGTVYDDLDNAGWFENNALYVANLASNTHDIHNNLRWEGDVLTNNGWIFNNDDATWVGDIVSNGPLDPNGRPGRIANAGGTWQGDILSNAGHIINDNIADESDFGYWFGDIYSNTNWIFNGGGGIWEGDVITNAGRIDNGKSAVWTGDVQSNASTVWNGGIWTGGVLGNAGTLHNAGGTWNGAVEANTGLIINIAGSDANGPTGGSTWIGDVTTNAGSILNAADSSWSGNVLANSGTIATLGLWTGDFSNAGRVVAENEIIGAFSNSGTLRLSGDLSGITALSNSSTIDMKGRGVQVLSVASASFESGSFLDVGLDSDGNSDQVAVAGLATLGGTVRISNSGAAHGSGPFTFITAGSFSGSFDAVTTDLAFLAPQLSYGSGSVSVAVQRNDIGFSTTGVTGNQISTGTAVEALAAGDAVYDAVLWLTEAEAQSAFDQLSGEVHASHASAAVESAAMIGRMASNRIDKAFAAFGETEADAQPGSNAVWGRIYGARSLVEAGSQTAGAETLNGGMVIGLDGMAGVWRLGLLLQGGTSEMEIGALDSSASSDDYGFGAYGGRQFGDTLVSFGAGYTRHDTSTTRQVDFTGFSDTLSADYASGTAQAFAEVAHRFDLGAVSLTPFAGLAYVRHATDAFTETGGAAALSSAANVSEATFASLGLGVERQVTVADGMLLTASGSLGWRHAFAETPISVQRFGSGLAFEISGEPVASDMLTLGGGLALDIGGGTSLDLTYAGQIGSGAQTHALQGTWSKRF